VRGKNSEEKNFPFNEKDTRGKKGRSISWDKTVFDGLTTVKNYLWH